MKVNHRLLSGKFLFSCLFATIFLCQFPQPTVSSAQVIDPIEPTHLGSLLTAKFGTMHDQTVPEVWEHSADYVTAHQQAQPPTTPGPIERAFGAFTVKNANDTDGDGLVDTDDDDVRAVGQNNRDEVDLIKFEIVLPENLNALSTIRLSSYGPVSTSWPGGAPCVVFWKHSTKTEKFGNGNTITLNSGTKGQTVEVWGEMTGQSTAIGGWYVMCTYVQRDGIGKNAHTLQSKYDRIEVTSIWAEALGTRASRQEVQIVEKPCPIEIVVPWVAGINMNPGDWVVIYDDRTGTDPAVFDTAIQCVMRRIVRATVHFNFPDMSVVEFSDPLPAWVDPGDAFTEGLSPEVDAEPLTEVFQDDSCFCHIGANRYRVFPTWGIESPFRALPEGIAVTSLSNGHVPGFDITRQLFVRSRQTTTIGVLRPPGKNWPNGTELPNDDPSQVSEDVEPENSTDRLISYDAPGWPQLPLDFDLRMEARWNFVEFSRVRLDGFYPEGNEIDGSRCSPNLKWHAVLDVVPQYDAVLELPFWKKTEGNGFLDIWLNRVVIGTHLPDSDILELEQ